MCRTGEYLDMHVPHKTILCGFGSYFYNIHLPGEREKRKEYWPRDLCEKEVLGECPPHEFGKEESLGTPCWWPGMRNMKGAWIVHLREGGEGYSYLMVAQERWLPI
jgi:hypothetical protein